MPIPNPTLNSFLTATQFNQITPPSSPIVAGMIAGSTYVEPTFNGFQQATSKDLGGLFGWLIYSRVYKSSPAVGTTASPYIVYNTASQLISDLNKLSGVTHALVSFTGSGGTFGLFKQTGATSIVPYEPVGTDFMHALHYLAYGARLVIAGSTYGLNQYETIAGTPLDLILGNTLNTSIGAYFRDKTYTIGIFPTGNNGQGTTAADFTTYLGGAAYISGTTISNRIFNIYGVNGGTYSVPSMQTNGICTFTIPAISDVGGAFNNTKTLNQLFLSIAGIDRSLVLNKKIQNTVQWSSSLKTTLRYNRVNFYVSNNPVFLGGDLVGATGSASEVTVNERIGPSSLKQVLTEEITNVGVKYLYELNDATTRNLVRSEVNSVINRYSYAIVPSETSIICSDANNTDYSSTLNIDVTVKPLLGVDAFVINVSLEG